MHNHLASSVVAAPRSTPGGRPLSLLFALVALLAAGCSAVRVRPLDRGAAFAVRHADVLDAATLSAATRESLRVVGLDESSCARAPRRCAVGLDRSSALGDEERLAASAELRLAAALADEKAGRLATVSYLEAARDASAYLFFAPRAPGERAFETRQLQLRDLYAFATERVATGFFSRASKSVDDPRTLALGGWTVDAVAVDPGLGTRHSYSELIPSSRLSFSGLRNAYRRDGIGAEFVAVASDGTHSAAPAAAPVSEPAYLPVSVVLRFPGETLAELLAARRATLVAYDSRAHERALLHGVEVPLAANFTAPYALWLERSRFGRQAKRAFAARSAALVEPRVLLTQPFDPNRATVVLIHGLASSPEAWTDLANELQGDAEIRSRYQIWQLFYRTSAPIAWNREAIRAALQATLDRFDPERRTRASRELVLVGHSMGGVLARLLVVDSGDELWRAFLGHQPSSDERSRLATLAPYLELRPLPEVGRVVLLASPHRGAPLAGGALGRFGSWLIRLPFALAAEAGRAADRLEAELPAQAQRIRTRLDSVESLSDRTPYLKATSALAIVPGVAYHSMIGCSKPVVTPMACTDGLVPYSSAHLDGAASELVVRSGHSVQEAPEAILELRRILRLHLAESGE